MQVGLKSDLTLTEEGKEQARKLAIFFVRNNILPSTIYCGYLQRQLQTANIIAQNFNTFIPIQQESAFNEIDYGLWEGLTQKQITAKWSSEYTKWQRSALWPDKIFNGSEQEHFQQIKNFFNKIDVYQKGISNIFIITSQGIVRYLLHALMPLNYAEANYTKNMLFYKIKTGHYCHFKLMNKETSLIAWDKEPN